MLHRARFKGRSVELAYPDDHPNEPAVVAGWPVNGRGGSPHGRGRCFSVWAYDPQGRKVRLKSAGAVPQPLDRAGCVRFGLEVLIRAGLAG